MENQNAQRKNRLRVLIAEDSITIQKQMHLAFADSPFEVITATDNREALAQFKSLRPEVVIVDWDSNQVQTPKLIEALRKQKSSARVVLLTSGNVPTRDSNRADLVLEKPVPSEFLVEAVRKLSGFFTKKPDEQASKRGIQTNDRSASWAEKEENLSNKLEAIAQEIVGSDRTLEKASDADKDSQEKQGKDLSAFAQKTEAGAKPVRDYTRLSKEPETNSIPGPNAGHEQTGEYKHNKLEDDFRNVQQKRRDEEFRATAMETLQDWMEDNLQEIVESQIQAWLDKEFPKLSERVLKEQSEQLSKLVQGQSEQLVKQEIEKLLSAPSGG